MDCEAKLAAIEAAGVDTAKLRLGLSGDDSKHQSTVYEVDVVYLFVAAGFTDILIEPPVPNSDKVADLLVRASGEDIYVEVEGWDRWAHHHDMYATATKVEAALKERGYPAADIHVTARRTSAASIISVLPPIADIEFGVAVPCAGCELTFIPPEDDRHGILSASSSRMVQNTKVINEAFPEVQVGDGTAPSYTDNLRARISEGYEQLRPATPEFATLVVVRPSVGSSTVVEAFEDALLGDRTTFLDGMPEAAAGTGSVTFREARLLDDLEPPEGFQPLGLFNHEENQGLSAAIAYCPPNFMGENGVFVGTGNPHATHVLPEGVGEALCEAAKREGCTNE